MARRLRCRAKRRALLNDRVAYMLWVATNRAA